MDFQTIFEQNPDTLQDLRDAIDDSLENPPDFVSLLKDHHEFLKDSVKVLTDPRASVTDKQFHLARFAALVQMHGHAEEETLYERLEADDAKQARLEGFGGQDEHDVAYRLLDELDTMDAINGWSDEIEAKAKVVATLVKTHIAEEESAMFKVAKSVIEKEELDSLARAYLMKCRDFFLLELPPPASLLAPKDLNV